SGKDVGAARRRRAAAAGAGRRLARRRVVERRAPGAAASRLRLPGLRALPAHDRARERRLRRAGGRPAGALPHRASGGRPAAGALRRRAAARRARACARGPAGRGALTEVALAGGERIYPTDEGEGEVGVVVYPWEVSVARTHADDSALNVIRGEIGSVVEVGNRVRVRVGPVTAEVTESSA